MLKIPEGLLEKIRVANKNYIAWKTATLNKEVPYLMWNDLTTSAQSKLADELKSWSKTKLKTIHSLQIYDCLKFINPVLIHPGYHGGFSYMSSLNVEKQKSIDLLVRILQKDFITTKEFQHLVNCCTLKTVWSRYNSSISEAENIELDDENASLEDRQAYIIEQNLRQIYSYNTPIEELTKMDQGLNLICQTPIKFYPEIIVDKSRREHQEESRQVDIYGTGRANIGIQYDTPQRRGNRPRQDSRIEAVRQYNRGINPVNVIPHHLRPGIILDEHDNEDEDNGDEETFIAHEELISRPRIETQSFSYSPAFRNPGQS